MEDETGRNRVRQSRARHARRTKQLALNTEMDYKRNDGHATVNGNLNNDWNASSFGFLFGAKLFF